MLAALGISFLAPAGGLLALAVALPLAAWLASERRSARLCRLLGLEPPPLRSRAPLAVALGSACGLLAITAAQPVLEFSRSIEGRSDAEAFFTVDISRSMLARPPRGGTRFARAQAAAVRLQAEIPDVPVGVASFTDRTLPHLFPTTDAAAVTTTLERSLGIERPPPEGRTSLRASNFYALSALASQNFFTPHVRRRLAVVFTDGESDPFDAIGLARVFQSPPGLRTIFIHFWREDERVYAPNGRPEPDYLPDLRAEDDLAAMVEDVGGRLFNERELDEAAAAMRDALGEGPKVSVGEDFRAHHLAPYTSLATLLPLGFLLWRRNL